MTPRTIPEGLRGELHQLALGDLAYLFEKLENGELELVDKLTELHFDAETGKATGVKTYSFTVRKAP